MSTNLRVRGPLSKEGVLRKRREGGEKLVPDGEYT